MLTYEYDRSRFTITELKHEHDVEIRVHCLQQEDSVHQAFHRMRKHFDGNDVITDVMLYVHHNEEYHWIVRHDFYTDFIINLFKHQLVTSVRWD
ncbi:hypothetical protein [Paenibacillus rigui]|uniref:Uncharacterized protein n=1 Tax=Paenibacillus rigui TaxID=554312 RepID=A0A229UTP7_9BACL|nr:hypothetical protein [Paenibacillus rigui]OXM86798.1 hypothetical protein CF651_08080 [Paenibacillus rigui]